MNLNGPFSLSLCVPIPVVYFCDTAMASTFICAFLVVLVLQPATASPIDGLLAPILSPVIEEVCKGSHCGKGTCKPSNNSTFLFECQCDPGWKQTFSEHDDHLNFLPCVIPNCTMHSSCAPKPVQERASKANESIFDVCYWSHCGGGKCNKTSNLTYNCLCQEGYDNLLNNTAFPCFKDCAIGLDCKNLGLSMPNKTASPAPALSEHSKNQARTIQGDLLLLIITVVFIAMLQWECN